MDDEALQWLEKVGYSKFADKLAEYGAIDLEDLTLIASTEPDTFVDKIGMKPLQAKKLSDMLVNPTHPKSPRPKHTPSKEVQSF